MYVLSLAPSDWACITLPESLPMEVRPDALRASTMALTSDWEADDGVAAPWPALWKCCYQVGSTLFGSARHWLYIWSTYEVELPDIGLSSFGLGLNDMARLEP